MKATVTSLNGSKERVTLPEPQWTGKEKWSAGLTLQAIYVGPRTGRMVIHLYSIWQGEVGDIYRLVTVDEYLRACEIANIEPVIN